MATEDEDSRELPSRSPSPPTAPPVPAAPGPRATALQKLYADAVAHILKTCNYTNFSACFPTPARAVPGSLKLLHEQFAEKLGDNMHREFESLLEERHVVGSLNELDALIEEARRKKGRGGVVSVPPHTLPASQLFQSHLAPSLEQYTHDIRERQDNVQEENVELLSRVIQQRREIEGLMNGLTGVIADLDASVATLQAGDDGVDLDGLREESRDVDEDMRMTA